MQVSRHVMLLLAVSGLFLFSAPLTSFADCDPAKALLEDDFEQLDPAWGTSNQWAELSVVDGALLAKPSAGNWRAIPNEAALYEDADICIDTTVTEATNPDEALLGILFWFEDFANFYVFQYRPTGAFRIERKTKGKWLTPFPFTPAPTLKQGVGAANKIEIRLRGKKATILINGTEAAKLKGYPPKGGGKVGVAVSTAPDSVAAFSFDNLLVSEPAD